MLEADAFFLIEVKSRSFGSWWRVRIVGSWEDNRGCGCYKGNDEADQDKDAQPASLGV